MTTDQLPDLDLLLKALSRDPKNLKPSEAVAIGRMLEAQEAPRLAEIRKQQGKRLSEQRLARERGEEYEYEPQPRRQMMRERIGKVIGMSGSNYDRAKKIVLAAEEDPEKFGDLLTKLDSTGNINGVWNALKRRLEQPDLVTAPSPTIRQKRRGSERLFRETVDTLAGVCTVLRAIDINTLDLTEVKTWLDEYAELVGELRAINKQLTERSQQTQ